MSVSVLDHFERNVELTPHHPAVILENGKVYSYHTLNILAIEIGKEVASAVHGVSLVDGDKDSPPLVAVWISVLPKNVAVAGVMAIPAPELIALPKAKAGLVATMVRVGADRITEGAVTAPLVANSSAPFIAARSAALAVAKLLPATFVPAVDASVDAAAASAPVARAPASVAAAVASARVPPASSMVVEAASASAPPGIAAISAAVKAPSAAPSVVVPTSASKLVPPET